MTTGCMFCGVTPHANHGFVYVIVFDGDIVKIGRSNDPSARVAQHIEICSVPVKEAFLFSVLDASQAEDVLLTWFYEFRLNDGEWFVIPKEFRSILEQTEFEINDCTFWH